LRHLAATNIRKKFGLEAASVLLGHAELSVTQVYAEQDKTKAVSVARQVG
jgi:site-specific recombinase XerC